MLTFSGFNGFGQFGAEHNRKLTSWLSTDAGFPVEEDVHLFVACSWSYIALAAGQRLRLQGFLAPQTQAQLDTVTPAKVKQLSANDTYCLVLLEDGRVYKLLPQPQAQLQEIKFAALHISAPPQKRSIFGDCKSVEQSLRIVSVACGAHIAVAISSCNAVYSIPSRIHQFPKHFRPKQLLCGFEHALLLSHNGDVYSWGSGLRGQLGQEVLRTEETPVLVEALAGIKITHIAAAGWHSAAISAFGDLYTWGFNSNGQLGLRLYKAGVQPLKEPTVYPLPQVIDLPQCCTVPTDTANECSPLKVYAGARHTVLQMSCGALLGSGWNAHGQLPLKEHKDYADTFEMLQLTDLQQAHRQLEVTCGPWCTILSK